MLSRVALSPLFLRPLSRKYVISYTYDGGPAVPLHTREIDMVLIYQPNSNDCRCIKYSRCNRRAVLGRVRAVVIFNSRLNEIS